MGCNPTMNKSTTPKTPARVPAFTSISQSSARILKQAAVKDHRTYAGQLRYVLESFAEDVAVTSGPAPKLQP